MNGLIRDVEAWHAWYQVFAICIRSRHEAPRKEKSVNRNGKGVNLRPVIVPLGYLLDPP